MSTLRREHLGPMARRFYDQQKGKASNAMPSAIAQRTRKGIRKSKFDAVEFLNICSKAGIQPPQLEYRFHPTRLWRFDMAWPSFKLAMEVDGGAFIQGRHTQGAGFTKDCEKTNSAAVIGWRILRVSPAQVLKYETIDLVKRAMRATMR